MRLPPDSNSPQTPPHGDGRPILFDLRYSATTIREICNRYLDALETAGYRRETVILKGPRDVAAERLIPADAFHWLELDAKALRGSRFSAAKRFGELCRQRRPDVVIAHRFKPVAVMARSRRWQEFRGVGVIHGVRQLDRFGRRVFARRYLRDPIHLVGVSQAVTHDLRRVCGAGKVRLHALPNCIDDEKLRRELHPREHARSALGLPPDAPVIGQVARLVRSKDQATLISAFARVRSEIPTARLCLIGDGPLRSELERRVRKQRLERAVHFCGWRDDAPRLLAAFDVFALTSVAEGFGLALAEAMAAGIPVVGTDVGGIGEVIGGIVPLCPPGDPDAIATRLVDLLRRPVAQRDQLSARLQDRVRTEYSVAVFRQRLTALLAGADDRMDTAPQR